MHTSILHYMRGYNSRVGKTPDIKTPEDTTKINYCKVYKIHKHYYFLLTNIVMAVENKFPFKSWYNYNYNFLL